jgi:hypothetical protein
MCARTLAGAGGGGARKPANEGGRMARDVGGRTVLYWRAGGRRLEGVHSRSSVTLSRRFLVFFWFVSCNFFRKENSVSALFLRNMLYSS